MFDKPALLWRTGHTVRYVVGRDYRDLGRHVCKSYARTWCHEHGVRFVDLDMGAATMPARAACA